MNKDDGAVPKNTDDSEVLRFRLKRSPEPLSISSRTQPPISAESHGWQVLLGELERYTRGDINGRSILISGHRGSGKTYLVRSAIQRISEKYKRQGTTQPLLVPINGPALLRPVLEAANEQQNITGLEAEAPEVIDTEDDGDTGEHVDDKAANESGLSEAIQSTTMQDFRILKEGLAELTVALYRALSQKFYESLCDRLTNLPQWDSPRRHELSELAAQFRLDMDGVPHVAELRDYWDRIGRLDTGVLYENPERTRQGTLELIALASASQAYGIIAGQLTQQKERAIKAAARQAQKSGSPTEAGDAEGNLLPSAGAVNKLVGALIGGGAGAALLSGAALGDVVGAVAIVLASVFVTDSIFTRTRNVDVQDIHNFIPNRDLADLDRELPNLIQRVKEAGLAPVFVVDELDKIDDLEVQMKTLIERLKHLVVESSFFCFLTDRDYFEFVRAEALPGRYPKEHTYFSRRIFVSYGPADLHRYLEARRESGDELQWFLLRYILLFESKMHLFDLMNLLARLRNKDGYIERPKAEAQGMRIRNEFRLRYQLAVEAVFAASGTEERIQADPRLSQLLADAVYYPLRKLDEASEWTKHSDDRRNPRSGDEKQSRTSASTIDVSAEEIRRYLLTRVSREKRSRRNENGAATNAEGAQGRDFTADDFSFVYGRFRQFLALFTSTQKLTAEIEKWWSDLRDVASQASPSSQDVGYPVPTHEMEQALVSFFDPEALPYATLNNDALNWSVNRFAERLDLTPAELIRREKNTREQASRLGQLDSMLAELVGQPFGFFYLADTVRVLDRTPNWATVSAEIQKLKDHVTGDMSYLQRDFISNEANIKSFDAMIRRAGPAIGSAVVLGAGIAAVANKSNLVGIGVLAHLGMENTELSGRADELVRLSNDFVERLGRPDNNLLESQDLDEIFASSTDWRDNLPEWRKATTAKIAQIKAEAIQLRKQFEATAPRNAAWSAWEHDLLPIAANRASIKTSTFKPGIVHLYCAAIEQSPATLLPYFDLSRMRLSDWMKVLFACLAKREEEHPDYAPLWLGQIAATALGIGSGFGLLGGIKDVSRHRIQAVQEEIKGGAEGQARRRAIIIRQAGPDSLVEDWSPSEEMGALVVTPEEFSQLKAPGADEINLAVPQILLIEPTEDGEDPIADRMPAWLENVRSQYIVKGGGRSPEGRGTPIFDPSSLDDLAAML